jgi:hypothetical protein
MDVKFGFRRTKLLVKFKQAPLAAFFLLFSCLAYISTLKMEAKYASEVHCVTT